MQSSASAREPSERPRKMRKELKYQKTFSPVRLPISVFYAIVRTLHLLLLENSLIKCNNNAENHMNEKPQRTREKM